MSINVRTLKMLDKAIVLFDGRGPYCFSFEDLYKGYGRLRYVWEDMVTQADPIDGRCIEATDRLVVLNAMDALHAMMSVKSITVKKSEEVYSNLVALREYLQHAVPDRLMDVARNGTKP